jgi:hypothetical protein
MCNHLNLKILIHIFTIIHLIMIIIIMRGENFAAHTGCVSLSYRIKSYHIYIIVAHHTNISYIVGLYVYHVRLFAQNVF